MIDSYEAVIRLNNAPTYQHERDVGSRTTVTRPLSLCQAPLGPRVQRRIFQQAPTRQRIFCPRLIRDGWCGPCRFGSCTMYM